MDKWDKLDKINHQAPNPKTAKRKVSNLWWAEWTLNTYADFKNSFTNIKKNNSS